MQNKEIEELELDLKELKFLLQEAKENETLIPVTKRHIGRFIKNLEAIRDNLFFSETEEAGTLFDVSQTPEEIAMTAETIQAHEIIAPPADSEDGAEMQEIEVITSISTVFGEQVRPAAELSKGLTLNDTFRFTRELFDGDKDRLNHLLLEISKMTTMNEVTSYLKSQIVWDEENEAVTDFIELLKKYFV